MPRALWRGAVAVYLLVVRLLVLFCGVVLFLLYLMCFVKIKNTPEKSEVFFLFSLNYKAALAFSTNPAKAAASFKAISAKTLRSNAMPALDKPFIKRE